MPPGRLLRLFEHNDGIIFETIFDEENTLIESIVSNAENYWLTPVTGGSDSGNRRWTGERRVPRRALGDLCFLCINKTIGSETADARCQHDECLLATAAQCVAEGFETGLQKNLMKA